MSLMEKLNSLPERIKIDTTDLNLIIIHRKGVWIVKYDTPTVFSTYCVKAESDSLEEAVDLLKTKL